MAAAVPVTGTTKQLFFMGAARLEDRVLVASFANSASVNLEPIRHMLAELNHQQIKDKQLYSFGHGSVAWSVTVAQGLILVLCTKAEYPHSIAKACLEELETGFQAKFADKWGRTKEGGLDAQAKPLLSQLCGRYDELANVSKIHATLAKVEAVKLVMQEAVETALENSVQMDAIGKKTEDLERNAKRFRINAQVMRRKMCWRNVKLKLVIVGAVVLGLGVMVLVILAQSGQLSD